SAPAAIASARWRSGCWCWRRRKPPPQRPPRQIILMIAACKAAAIDGTARIGVTIASLVINLRHRDCSALQQSRRLSAGSAFVGADEPFTSLRRGHLPSHSIRAASRAVILAGVAAAALFAADSFSAGAANAQGAPANAREQA